MAKGKKDNKPADTKEAPSTLTWQRLVEAIAVEAAIEINPANFTNDEDLGEAFMGAVDVIAADDKEESLQNATVSLYNELANAWQAKRVRLKKRKKSKKGPKFSRANAFAGAVKKVMSEQDGECEMSELHQLTNDIYMATLPNSKHDIKKTSAKVAELIKPFVDLGLISISQETKVTINFGFDEEGTE